MTRALKKVFGNLDMMDHYRPAHARSKALESKHDRETDDSSGPSAEPLITRVWYEDELIFDVAAGLTLPECGKLIGIDLLNPPPEIAVEISLISRPEPLAGFEFGRRRFLAVSEGFPENAMHFPSLPGRTAPSTLPLQPTKPKRVRAPRARSVHITPSKIRFNGRKTIAPFFCELDCIGNFQFAEDVEPLQPFDLALSAAGKVLEPMGNRASCNVFTLRGHQLTLDAPQIRWDILSCCIWAPSKKQALWFADKVRLDLLDCGKWPNSSRITPAIQGFEQLRAGIAYQKLMNHRQQIWTVVHESGDPDGGIEEVLGVFFRRGDAEAAVPIFSDQLEIEGGRIRVSSTGAFKTVDANPKPWPKTRKGGAA